MKPKPVFVIEVKRAKQQYQFMFGVKIGITTLEDSLPQLFEYLRLLCLEHHLPHMCGVLTNY
jgi:hypothetical protein